MVTYLQRAAKKMHRVIRQWINTPAEWWEFWLPQSGLVGGVVFYFIMAVAMCAVFYFG